MAGVDASDLHALAVELLEAATVALETLPALGFAGAPERSFVTPGEPAFDLAGSGCCDQLTVQMISLDEAPTFPDGLAAGRRTSTGRINHVTLGVTIVRCIPVGSGTASYTPPTPDELEVASQQIHADGWALWNHLYNRVRAGVLFSLCREVFWLGGRVLGPEGGCAGWSFGFRVALDGYEEVLELT